MSKILWEMLIITPDTTGAQEVDIGKCMCNDVMCCDASDMRIFGPFASFHCWFPWASKHMMKYCSVTLYIWEEIVYFSP